MRSKSGSCGGCGIVGCVGEKKGGPEAALFWISSGDPSALNALSGLDSGTGEPVPLDRGFSNPASADISPSSLAGFVQSSICLKAHERIRKMGAKFVTRI